MTADELLKKADFKIHTLKKYRNLLNQLIKLQDTKEKNKLDKSIINYISPFYYDYINFMLCILTENEYRKYKKQIMEFKNLYASFEIRKEKGMLTFQQELLKIIKAKSIDLSLDLTSIKCTKKYYYLFFIIKPKFIICTSEKKDK